MLYTLKGGFVYHDNKIIKTNVVVSDGKIKSIGENIEGDIVDVTGLYLAPAFMDPHVHMREPGFTESETIKTGSLAASAGGYTHVFLMPNTNPVISSADEYNNLLEIIKRDSVIEAIPLVSITIDEKSEKLVDFDNIDALYFSDDGKPVMSSLLMYQAMQKAKELNKHLLCHCEDLDLVNKGIFNNSKIQEENNLKPNLDVSETTMVARDLVLANKTCAHYHVCHLATKESLDLVKFYKSIGCNVTVEVTPHHIVLNDEMIEATSDYKMNPPIRGKKDQEALIAGIINGDVDMISTDHAPHCFEKKNKDLSEAAFGIVGLETSFPLLYTHLVKTNKISLEKLFDLMSKNVAVNFDIKPNDIEVGNNANIAVIDLDNEFIIDKNTFKSKGRNTPFDKWKCYGKIKKTIFKGAFVYEI